ncbi:integrase catalytic domain-containing protein [Trichonephila clavipes]|nr:integrase catalytic domain-containing protein [Trichonephila clavipes]
MASKCKAKPCKLYAKRHHVSFHFPKQNTNFQTSHSKSNAFHPSTESRLNAEEREFNPTAFPLEEVSEKGSNAVFAINQKEGSTSVFLSSVKCIVKDSYGQKRKIRGLLDVGSMTNLITKKFVEKLGLRNEKIKITDLTPVKNLNVKGLIPENINLANDSFYVPGPIDCLLGAEIFYELLRSGQIRSENSNRIFQNTVFGFVASGSNSFADTEEWVHCGLIKGDLNQTLKMFGELENVEVERTKNEEAIFCEDHFLKTHSRDDECRYVVKMPLKTNQIV